MIKRLLSMILALAVFFSLMPNTCIPAAALESTDAYPTLEPDTMTNVEITNGGDYAYFQYTPEYTESYTFYSVSDGDTYGYLYDSGLNQLSSDDDDGEGSVVTPATCTEDGSMLYKEVEIIYLTREDK